jgi:hypothetical protein
MHPVLFSKVVFKTILYDFYGLLANFWRFLVIFGGSWALFEARSWGEVGRWLPTSGLYKPEALESMGGISGKRNAVEILRQSHFYAGKLLRSAPLRAISGSFIHPFSVSSILMGS